MQKIDGKLSAPGRRNRYFRFKQMRVEEFAVEQDYLIERRRLINRSVLGWGVVFGFGLKPDDIDKPLPQPVTIQPGFALDQAGREIELAEAVEIDDHNTFLLANNVLKTLESCVEGDYLLSVHYAERKEYDAPGDDACGCDKPEKRFVRELPVFTLTLLQGDLKQFPCAEGPCRRPVAAWPEDPARLHACDKHHPRHRSLCAWAAQQRIRRGEPLVKSDQIDDLCIAIREGVGLAWVHVVKNSPAPQCKSVRIDRIRDVASPRRVVKNNNMLYDISRGCGLTRIESVSWEPWLDRDRIDFAQLKRAVLSLDAYPQPRVHSFTVRFSGPVRTGTLRSRVVNITAWVIMPETHWLVPRRFPVIKLDFDKGPGDTTKEFTVRFEQDWVDDEINNPASAFSPNDFNVDIEIYGDLILDRFGLPVDANAIGQFYPHRIGDGTPGGTYRSTFTVKAKSKK